MESGGYQSSRRRVRCGEFLHVVRCGKNLFAAQIVGRCIPPKGWSPSCHSKIGIHHSRVCRNTIRGRLRQSAPTGSQIEIQFHRPTRGDEAGGVCKFASTNYCAPTAIHARANPQLTRPSAVRVSSPHSWSPSRHGSSATHLTMLPAGNRLYPDGHNVRGSSSPAMFRSLTSATLGTAFGGSFATTRGPRFCLPPSSARWEGSAQRVGVTKSSSRRRMARSSLPFAVMRAIRR